MPALSSVADLIMGQSPPSTTYNDAGNGLPFFQGKTDFGSRHPNPRKFCCAPLKIAQPGDVLISVRAPVGPTNIANRECCIGRGLAAIRPQKIYGEFLWFNLRHLEPVIASFGTGTIFQAINRIQLGSVEVNQTGFNESEQRKIAAVLGLVQRAIEQQERLLALTVELKKTLLHQLFTRGLRNEPQKQTEIGLIPQSWEFSTLGDIAQFQSGGTPSRRSLEYWKDGNIPWVKTTEINYKVIEQTEEKITRKGLENSAAKIFAKGTIVVAMYGQGVTRGRAGILGIDAATNQACAAITPNDSSKIISQFIYFFLEFHYEHLRQMGHGANQRNLNIALLKGFPFAFPKLDEQHEICDSLLIVDAKMEFHRRKHAALSDLFRTLLHELMTANIRVDGINIDEHTKSYIESGESNVFPQ